MNGLNTPWHDYSNWNPIPVEFHGFANSDLSGYTLQSRYRANHRVGHHTHHFPNYETKIPCHIGPSD